MPKYLSSIIFYSSAFAVVIPLFLSWYNYSKTYGPYRVLTWHLTFAASLNAVAMVLSHYHIKNLPLLHIYTLVEFGFIAVFYSFILGKTIRKEVFYILIGLFSLLAITNALYIQGWEKFNTLPRSVESLIVIVLCILTYYRMLIDLEVNKVYRDPVFWINTGFLVYFSGALFLFMMSNYILPLNHKLNIMIWLIHALFSDMLYLLIFAGLWNIRKT